MRNPLRLVLTFVTFALLGAPPAAEANHVCTRGKSYAAGSVARVVAFEDHLWGCVEGQRRAHVVVYPFDFGAWRLGTVAGTFTALEVSESSQECESRVVRVADLRTGRRWTMEATSGSAPCTGQVVSDLVLRSDGLIVFIAGQEVIQWSPRRDASLLLDAGPNVAPKSLSFDRGGVLWTVDGRRKRAELPKLRR